MHFLRKLLARDFFELLQTQENAQRSIIACGLTTVARDPYSRTESVNMQPA